MTRVVMLIPVAAVLLACSLVASGKDPAPEVVDTPDASAEKSTARVDKLLPPPTGEAPPQIASDTPDASAENSAARVDKLLPPPTGEAPPQIASDLPLPLYAGDSLIEEKIVEYPVIVRATVTSFSSDTFLYPDGTFRPVLQFNLNVREYLKGTGPTNIVAVWFYGRSYNTRDEADNRRAAILEERDAQWDDREAIFFLFDVASAGPLPLLSTQPQIANQYILGLGSEYRVDDRYSLHSKRNKRWLPAASSAGSTGDSQEFLLDVPPPTETITLGDLKRKVTQVAADLDGGDGSEEYRECVLDKYRHIRNQRNWPEERGSTYGVWDLDYSLVSGQPVGTEINRHEAYGGYPDTKITFWFEGSGASLLDIADSDSTASDRDGDGEYDTITYDVVISLARPLPAGEYRFDLKEDWPRYAVCSYVISNEWTVVAVAPEAVVHEALFDPVTDGSAVAADSSNGVLEPASFIDAGATTTIERIEWEAGTTKMKLTPHTALAGRVLDFMELDGTVSLSLIVDDATVDAANNTLIWPVSLQPWEDGDKIMLRIREVVSTCTNGVVVPNHAANLDLVADCSTLLAARDVLKGTATLDWNATSTISTWEGIGLNATSTRVTSLDLNDQSLDGTIPPALGDLSALETLDLSDNDLTGEIPEELGNLANLQTLRLSGNSFAGCIPPTLEDVPTNDLASLNIQYCQAPAPSGVSASLSDGTFSIGWTAMSGVDQYEVQYQTDDPADNWAIVGATTTTSLTYTPVDGPTCGTTYQFRVRAYGDGTKYQASWGPESAPEDVTTAECDRAPTFGSTHYSFSIAEDAATSTSVGTVSATDEDGDTLTYEIAGGDPDGKFSIGSGTGSITLSGEVDSDVLAFYSLEVEADDGNDNTATTTVGVSLLLSECSNGTVVPRPRSNPHLVRDCSMLLAARDTLAGDGSLDWSADTRINDWQGVTVHPTPSPFVRVLFLTEQGLTGSIPPELGGVADVRRVDLDYNTLTGGIPRELGSLPDLELLYLTDNQLSGSIPPEIGNLRSLKTLYLSYNNLTGALPSELGRLSRLTQLVIEDNSLTGGIPPELGDLSNLRSLYLSANMLTGGIPPELGKLSNLTQLLLERNSLGGEIPSQLGSLTRLEHVYLRNNGLTGAIPSEWGDLSNLTRLYLSSGNNLTGCIPAGLRDVAENDLAGLGLEYCGSSGQ